MGGGGGGCEGAWYVKDGVVGKEVLLVEGDHAWQDLGWGGAKLRTLSTSN